MRDPNEKKGSNDRRPPTPTAKAPKNGDNEIPMVSNSVHRDEGAPNAVDDENPPALIDAAVVTEIAPGSDTPAPTALPHEALSKNRRKKLEKRERANKKKLERKATQRAERRATAIAQGRDLDAERRFVEERTLSGDRQKRLDALWDSKKLAATEERRFAICIDLGARRDSRNVRAVFEEAMREREIASLAQQIRYCYSYNKKSPNPVVATVTGLTQRRELPAGDAGCGSDDNTPTLRELLERETGFSEWSRRMFECTEWTLEEHYGLGTAADGDAEIGEKQHPEISPEPPSTPLSQRRKKIVYLTSDSPNTLDHLEEDTVYVIGGIVDRNRLKRATIDRAQHELNIDTAKLPLREYLLANQISMTTTKVLTVNHVFDILLKYREHGNDWNEAFRAVLPSRKV